MNTQIKMGLTALKWFLNVILGACLVISLNFIIVSPERLQDIRDNHIVGYIFKRVLLGLIFSFIAAMLANIVGKLLGRLVNGKEFSFMKYWFWFMILSLVAISIQLYLILK